jgi:hypothetical protein
MDTIDYSFPMAVRTLPLENKGDGICTGKPGSIVVSVIRRPGEYLALSVANVNPLGKIASDKVEGIFRNQSFRARKADNFRGTEISQPSCARNQK